MRVTTFLPLSLLLALTTAQTTLSAAALPSSTACAAKGVFDACIATGMGYVTSCGVNDWGCLCQKWGDIMTCYLQCPNDPGLTGASSNKETYCNNAIIYGTTTSSAISRAVSSDPVSLPTNAGPSNTAGDSAVTPTTDSNGAVRTASAPASSSTNGAERMVVGVGAGILGLVVAVL